MGRFWSTRQSPSALFCKQNICFRAFGYTRRCAQYLRATRQARRAPFILRINDTVSRPTISTKLKFAEIELEKLKRV